MACWEEKLQVVCRQEEERIDFIKVRKIEKIDTRESSPLILATFRNSSSRCRI
jgi:hypothetical protein